MAKKYLEEKITGTGNLERANLKSQDLTVSNKIADILKNGIEIKKEINGKDKIIKFGINEFDRMPLVLNDKRLEKILINYLPHLDTIYLIDREKYDTKKTSRDKLCDLQDTFQKIDEEQLQIVDAILKKEEEILFEYLKKEAEKENILPRYVERYINRTVIEKPLNREEYNKYKDEYKDKLDNLIKPLLKDDNRIETKKLLQLVDFQIENISHFDEIILNQDVKDEIFYSLVQKINIDSLLTETDEEKRKNEKKDLIEMQNKLFKGEEKKDDIVIDKNNFTELTFKTEILKLVEKLSNEDLKNKIKAVPDYNYTNIVIRAIIIKTYRDKAFHNGIPEKGTFEDGLKILANIN